MADQNRTTTSTGEELTLIVDSWARAIVAGDAARIAGFMADDWVIVSETGVGTREQFLSLVGSGALTHSAMDRVSDARVRAYGDAAVVTMRQTNTAHFDARRFDADEWVTDVFVRRDQRWVCVLSQITPVGAPTARG
jgi:uncharacterized protein (TIGR02246 family)